MKMKEDSEEAGLKLNIQKTKIMASSPITSWQIDGETVNTVSDFILGGSKITADGDCSHEIKRHLLLGRKVMTNLESILKSRDITLSTKICLVKAMVFPVVMHGCESWTKESWVLKNWCFWNVVLEKTLENPLDCKEIQPVHPKGDQSWVFIGRTEDEAETPVLWPPDAKNWLIWRDPDAGKDWRQEEKGTTEDEMVGWHHRLNGHEFGWTLGVGDGQGGLACCDSWGCKGSDTIEWLNWNWNREGVSPLLFLKYSFHFLLGVSLIALYFLFKHRGRTSLEVQWLRLHASVSGSTISIPGWGTKIPHASWCSKKKKKNGGGRL